MLRVRCQATAKLDAKGRVALPAQLRRALGAEGVDALVLTFHKGAVWGWTPSEFEESVEKPMSAQDPFDDAVTDFAHALLAPAQDVDIDGSGRIRVPQLLRELAEIDREVVINSLHNRIEIWDKAAWDERFRQALDRTRSRSGMPGRGG